MKVHPGSPIAVANEGKTRDPPVEVLVAGAVHAGRGLVVEAARTCTESCGNRRRGRRALQRQEMAALYFHKSYSKLCAGVEGSLGERGWISIIPPHNLVW